MKAYTLSEIASMLSNQYITAGNFETLLSYYILDSDKVVGNLNTGINIIIDDESILEKYHLTTDMFWPQISKKIYDTDALYWFLMLLNPNATTTPFGKVKAPGHILYLPTALNIIRNA